MLAHSLVSRLGFRISNLESTRFRPSLELNQDAEEEFRKKKETRLESLKKLKIFYINIEKMLAAAAAADQRH